MYFAAVDLDPAQEASVLEWMTHEADGSHSLIVYLQARWIPPKANKRGRVEAITCSGPNGTGPEIGTAVRELIRATYLRPLRDAEAELRPGRQSRLAVNAERVSDECKTALTDQGWTITHLL